MFCVLAGSTAPSARLDPEHLRGIIEAYHRCSAKLIGRNAGFVAKCMATVCLLISDIRKPTSIIRRELLTRVSLEAVPKLTTNAGSSLRMRVGIATGLVVVSDLFGSGEPPTLRSARNRQHGDWLIEVHRPVVLWTT